MTLVQFFTASGVLAWLFLGWRAFQQVRGLRHRLGWALWGHRRPQRVGRFW